MIHIYQDIDGVINSFSKNPPKQNTGWQGEWKKKQIEGYPILWSVELVEALNAIAARDDVQFKWLTTWQSLAPHSFASQIGIDGVSWPFFETTDDRLQDVKRWWKLEKIQEDVAKTKPDKIVWLDDDLRWASEATPWLLEQRPNLLGISPYGAHGLTKKEVGLITDFIDS